MKLCRTGLACLLFLNAFLTCQAETPPELKILGRYIGNWNGTVEKQTITSTNKTSWILNGQLVEQKYLFQDGGEGFIHRGWDKQSGQYFFNLHDSRGIHWMLKGHWNEATKTFTFEGYSGETSITVKSTFRNDETEDWTITLDTNGNITELRGTNVRVGK